MDVSSLHMSKMDVSSRAANGDVGINKKVTLQTKARHEAASLLQAFSNELGFNGQVGHELLLKAVRGRRPPGRR